MEEQKEASCKESNDSRRPKAPDRRKHEEEVEGYQTKIRELEVQLAALKSEKNARALSDIRHEKEVTIDMAKKVNSDLKTLNMDISEKTNKISQMQSGLVYKNEDKHNDAIRKLDWNLAHHSYRLTEERKIVAEIDKLKRSKRSVCAYNSAKSQIDDLRSKQRKLREERDNYSKTINALRTQEDEVKRLSSTSRTKLQGIKCDLDEQYQAKRKCIDEFKRQLMEFQEAQKKKKKESFIKKAEERKAIIEAKQNEEEELENLRIPYEDECKLCNTLMSYLQQRCPVPDTQQSSNDKIQCNSVTSSQNQGGGASNGPAEELEDGNLILLRKTDDNDFIGGNVRKQNKKFRKPRKPSMTKLITHCAQVISQFNSLNLRVPCSAQEIPASLEQLRARKLFYEQKAETESNVSLTESGICEMSRQASNTESCDSMCETRPPDFVLDQIQKNCCPDFACEADSFIPHHGSHSSDSNHTPRNLSLSSGSVMSMDAEDLDSNCQSFDSSYSHLSHIGESDFCFKPKQPIDEVLINENTPSSLNNQSNTVSYNIDKPQLNQPVASTHVDSKVTKNICEVSSSLFAEHDASVNEKGKCEQNTLSRSNATNIAECDVNDGNIFSVKKTADVNRENEVEITHL